MADTGKEYASALFSLAVEKEILDGKSGALDEIYSALLSAGKAFAENPEYTEFLLSPNIPVSERIDALNAALDGMPEYVCSFAAMLVERGLIGDYDKCVREFDLLYKEAKKSSVAYVTSAAPLSDEQVLRLKEKLEQMSGSKVDVICTVDKSLIAGVRVVMGETVIDGTVKERLQDIKDMIV